ncbi:hypothetical protein E2562_003721 [Oryza meyeriana var. granulata]|uniref:Uncharacterized protein n=1 Tax=Oryza meyeriana var. granulata TaxID=110450 RepID=A0A6G1C4E6_9ORYZ|nr:hypothetical protein E2562_003721 [Oryza meyeriana var. granulata]
MASYLPLWDILEVRGVYQLLASLRLGLVLGSLLYLNSPPYYRYWPGLLRLWCGWRVYHLHLLYLQHLLHLLDLQHLLLWLPVSVELLQDMLLHLLGLLLL